MENEWWKLSDEKKQTKQNLIGLALLSKVVKIENLCKIVKGRWNHELYDRIVNRKILHYLRTHTHTHTHTHISMLNNNINHTFIHKK